jgi:hypothetical protein
VLHRIRQGKSGVIRAEHVRETCDVDPLLEAELLGEQSWVKDHTVRDREA